MTDLHKLECVAWRYMDWTALIDDLEIIGHSNAAIARAINVPLTTLRDWKQGREPRYSNGEALLLIHSKLLGQDYTKNRIQDFKRSALMWSPAPNNQGEDHAERQRATSSSTG